MRLIESIIDANHRAIDGDTTAGLDMASHLESLPLAALTCIDPRLNNLLPGALGITAENFIWLRNAGNIVFNPLSSMVRMIALACAIKKAREVMVIGHTDCKVGKTSVVDLLDNFAKLGVQRSALPDDLVGFFGLFSSENQNVIKATEAIRKSPLIGSKIPVHGLMLNVQTGRLEWLVNGYETLNLEQEK